MKYRRILLKLSGEVLMGEKKHGIDLLSIEKFASEIKNVHDKNVGIAIVIGGGNIFRGLPGMAEGIERVQGDYMGMLATVINSMALQSVLEKKGVPVKHLSGFQIDPLCEKMSSDKAIKNLGKGKVVIISGGTGNPFFTTDTAAALRAVEIRADVILKGTRVDGVYTADPEKDKSAVKYDKLSFDEAYDKGLMIMDLTAFTMCRENKIPIIVFNINQQGNLEKIVTGEKVGTLVYNT